VQYSSAASLARQKEATAVYNNKKQGTAKESERQKSKKARQLGREVPAGDLRALLQDLRPTFAATLAKTAQGRLFATTMKTIDEYFQTSVDKRPKGCRVAVFDVELVSPDSTTASSTGLPVSAGLFQAGTAMHARSIQNVPTRKLCCGKRDRTGGLTVGGNEFTVDVDPTCGGSLRDLARSLSSHDTPPQKINDAEQMARSIAQAAGLRCSQPRSRDET
jgi:hypothetical protein